MRPATNPAVPLSRRAPSRIFARTAFNLPLTLASVFTLALIGCDRGQHPGQIGQPAPLFTVSDGQHTADLSQMRGKVVVLNFWASWCPPCAEEIPSLAALHRDLPQVELLAVSFDEDHAAYERFLTRYGVNFPTVNDTQGNSNKLYGSTRPPETYIIDKSGIIRRKFIGPQDWTSPEIENYLRKLAS